MNCYLHLGTEKTGTTSIQGFLEINRDILRNKFNLIYPLSTGIKNSKDLAIACMNTDNPNIKFIKRLQLNSEKELLEYKNDKIKLFKDEISKIPENYNIVLSSEHFHSRLTTYDELNKLKQVLNSTKISKIIPIIYVRSPHELATSLYFTSIKNGYHGKGIPDPSNKYYKNLCDHKTTILRIKEVFGEDLVIRLFQKESLKERNVILDFLNILNINWSDSFKDPGVKNQSLSALGLELLRRLNKTMPLYNKNGVNLNRAAVLRFMLRSFNDGPKFQIQLEKEKAYKEFYEESNEWLRKNYFPEREYLFTDKPRFDDNFEYPEKDLRNLIKFIKMVINRKQPK